MRQGSSTGLARHRIWHPISLGNTPFELGVHLAAALPEVIWMEYSFPEYEHLVEEPVACVDGYALAPERPRHGLVLSAAARSDDVRPPVD